MDLKAVLVAALQAATTQQIEDRSPGDLHRMRSSIWVERLADQFRAHYGDDLDVRVFST